MEGERMARDALRAGLEFWPEGWQSARMFRFRTGAALALLAAGCATTPDSDLIAPLTDAQRVQMAKAARVPETFGLTIYRSERGPIFAGGNRLHPGETARLPFATRDEPTPIVPLQPREARGLRALVDTTSRDNWVTLAASAALRVTLLGPPPFQRNAVHAFDEFGGYAGAAYRLKLDEMDIESALFNVRAATGPLGQLARGRNAPRPDLVFGSSFLRSFAFVQLDFAARQAFFSATVPYQPEADRLLVSLPMKDVQGAIAVEGAWDGEPKLFLVDTAGDFHVAASEPSEDEARQISLGDLVVRRVPVTDSQQRGLGLLENPRIGLGLLSRYRVTFDFRKKLIHFERPDA